MKPAFAFGSFGFLVERLQSGLSVTNVTGADGVKKPAFDATKINGRFGTSTRAAVRLVQAEFNEPQSGVVDATLWKEITGEQWPPEFIRSLHLTAGFEGHGFTFPAGNWDNAGITWGIIGFTLLSGGKRNSLPVLIENVIKAHPGLIEACFGKDMAKEVTAIPVKTDAQLLKFANDITDWVPRKPGKRAPTPKSAAKATPTAAKSATAQKSSRSAHTPWYGLLKPWEDGFIALGEHHEVQSLQEELARAMFYAPALVNAKEFASWFPSLDCEQTRQLFFDIHVNNPAPSKELKQAMKAEIDKLDPEGPVKEKLLAITEVLVKTLKPKFRPDVRERKGTIAQGSGTIHGAPFRLDGWGIEVADQVLEFPSYLGVLSFEPQQTMEQLTLAGKSRQFVNPEAAVLAGALPDRSGTELLSGKVDGTTVNSLSLRPLLSQPDAFLLSPEAAPLNQAIAIAFGRPIGMLAVFGQGAAPKVAAPRLLFARGPLGYVGLDVAVDGSMQLFRQRLFSEAPEMARMDIADIRRSLGACQLIFLFGAHGIEQVPGDKSPGRLWIDLLKPFGASPIVLGWFGGACVPRDADAQFVSGVFLDAVRKLDPKATLEQLVATQGEKIVQLWGQACHATFAAGKQHFLWRGGPFSSVFPEGSTLGGIGLCGAAGIGRNGQLYLAKAGYTGQGDAMELAL